MKLISFATDDPFFQMCKIIFETHHRAMGFDVEVTTLPRDGSWLDMCNFKPKFLLEKYQSITDRPLIWLDVDCLLHRFDGFDKTGVGALLNPNAVHCPLSCGIFAFGDNSEGFLQKWVSLISNDSHDHVSVCKIYRENLFSPIHDLRSSLWMTIDGIKMSLKQLRGTLPCPWCGAMYWESFRYCTLFACDQCKNVIEAGDWK